MYDHYCPKMSPNDKRPNMRKVGCAEKIRLRLPGCSQCTSGVGYVAPVKIVKPKPVKKPVVKRVRKPRPVIDRFCACGAKVEKLKSHCDDCREVKRKNVIIRARVKNLQRRVDINLKIIGELSGKLGKEYTK